MYLQPSRCISVPQIENTLRAPSAAHPLLRPGPGRLVARLLYHLEAALAAAPGLLVPQALDVAVGLRVSFQGVHLFNTDLMFPLSFMRRISLN